MTRKDYERIARGFIRNRPDRLWDYFNMNDWEKGAYDSWHTGVIAMATELADDNPRFDRARFLKACGLEA